MSETAGTIDSPVGPLYLAATTEGLTHLLFGGDRRRNVSGDDSHRGAMILADAHAQLMAYFNDASHVFNLPLAPTGTAFQLSVWRELIKIPFGHTISYGELARRIARPKAVRAVGAANGANPISIIAPCHRVIGSNGRLTGFGGGLPAKSFLLCHEGLPIEGNRLVSPLE